MGGPWKSPDLQYRRKFYLQVNHAQAKVERFFENDKQNTKFKSTL